MAAPLVGVSWMPQAGFRTAVAPLLARGAIEAVEWTVDMGFGPVLPPSAPEVLDAFGRAGRLWAHGVGYSPLGASRDDLARAWLGKLAEDVRRHRYRSLSEHFGWSGGGAFDDGPPLPAPRTATALAAGRERLRRLAEVSGLRIGLENLALALSREDALEHAAFLVELISEVDGYLHLDLHNLWCQAVNFDIDPDELLSGYPPERVRVVHVSGGSWVDGVRRDTHDDRVPEEVWALLLRALPRLPAVEVVFVERIGPSFGAPDAPAAFAADYLRLVEVRDQAIAASPETSLPRAAPPPPIDDAPMSRGEWAAFQARALELLYGAPDGAKGLAAALGEGAPAPIARWLARADPRMIDAAARVVRRWGRRGAPDVAGGEASG